MGKEFKVLVNVYDNVDVDAERVRIDMLNRISNQIELAKYVNFWKNRWIITGEDNVMYKKICIRLRNKFIKGKNAYVIYGFDDDWNMVIEIGKVNPLMN